MKIKDYLYDNLISIIIYIIALIFILILISIFNIPIYIMIIISIVYILCGLFIIIYSFIRKNRFYKEFNNNLSKLDKKYLILETINNPNSLEEKIIYDYLYDINNSMIENINNYRDDINNFKEYLELWIHEVKIPISSIILKIHNNKDKYSKELLSLVRRIDNNIDEILYYSRMEISEKDFSIKEENLKDIIREVSIKNKDDLLDNDIDFSVNVDGKVYTDKKWIVFIINQIINNSIKYKKEDSFIKINSKINDNKVILSICDNGIGIPEEDIDRVFEKSFTGTNGRNKIKSTGMGLYIVKNLCNKLGHSVYIESEINEYTNVYIEFGINEFSNVTKK